jgi:hypothetical protein
MTASCIGSNALLRQARRPAGIGLPLSPSGQLTELLPEHAAYTGVSPEGPFKAGHYRY